VAGWGKHLVTGRRRLPHGAVEARRRDEEAIPMTVIPLFNDHPGFPAPRKSEHGPRGGHVQSELPGLRTEHHRGDIPDPRQGHSGYGGSGLARSGERAGASSRGGRGRHRQPAVSAPPPASAVALIEQARRGLAVATAEEDIAERYAGAHLAALRAAAAVVAVRARPDRRRQRPLSVWALLASLAPELREWATFFAAGSKTRAAVQAGVTRLVTARDADDLVRQSEEFIDLAERVVRGGHR
jgi:SAV_6107-like HEPN